MPPKADPAGEEPARDIDAELEKQAVEHHLYMSKAAMKADE